MTAATAYQCLGEKFDEHARRQKAPIDEDDLDHHRNAPLPDPACLYGLVGDIAAAGGATPRRTPTPSR